MALDMILLGFLQEPASGYDLKKAFDQTVRHFWDAELSQIYPVLHRLRRQGLVTMSIEPSDRGPDRKVYARTAAGLSALREWLAAGPVVENQRIEHLAQLFFLGQAEDPDRTRIFLEDLRNSFRRRLAALRAIEARALEEEVDAAGGHAAETVHPYLTLRYGIHRMAATVAWCEESLDRLASAEIGEGPGA